MNAQEALWAGEFGDDYLKRNQVDWKARVPFWRDIATFINIRSAHEVGCNAGWNLLAIRSLAPKIALSGNDLNASAILHATNEGLSVAHGTSIRKSDLVFTCGVLIHVAPEQVIDLMGRIVDASQRYVLAVEYEDKTEVELQYRGNDKALWRRPYGRMYQDMGLKLIWCERQVPGFDNCTAWLLEKKS